MRLNRNRKLKMRPLAFSLLTTFVLFSMGSCSEANPQSQQCIANGTECKTTLVPNQTQRFSPRQLRFPIGGDWHQVIDHSGLFILGITSTIATVKILQILKSLYQKILDALLDAWAKSPGSNQLVVEAGSLRWEFGCTMVPVPQAFLEEYFQSKRDAVERGFLPMYEREWAFNRTDRGRYCFAGMRIAEEGEDVVPPDRGTRSG